MRPFLIPGTRKWVDLDTVQTIDGPRIKSWALEAHIVLQHAFREGSDTISIQALRSEWFDPDPSGDDPAVLIEGPDGVTHFETRVTREVLEPLLAAWRATP